MDLGASGRAEKSFSSTITHYPLLTAHYFPLLEEYSDCALPKGYCYQVSFGQRNPLAPIGAATKIACALGNHVPLRGNGVKHWLCCKAARAGSCGRNAMSASDSSCSDDLWTNPSWHQSCCLYTIARVIGL